MSDKGYAVRLHAIDGERTAVAQALSRVFGLDVNVAARLLDSLPRIVKRDASQEDAQRIAEALQAIGAQVEVFAKPLQPARVVLVGTPEVDVRAPANTNANPDLVRARQALTIVGMLDVESLAPSTPREQPAPLPPIAAKSSARWEAPATLVARPRPAAARVPHELAPVPSAAPVLESLAPERLQALELAAASSAAPMLAPLAAEHSQAPELAAHEPVEVGRDRFALPADPPPSAAAIAVRPASARLQPKQRSASSVAAASSRHEPKHRALAAHPVARFLIVLGATSAVFLLALLLL